MKVTKWKWKIKKWNARKFLFVSHEDIFEIILHICFKKKQQLDIKGAFNYLTKLKKMEDVSFDFFKPETINLDK